MKKNEVWITGTLLIIIILIVGYVTINFNDSKFGLYEKGDFWENILVEAHGFILDVFIIGFLLLIILNRVEKNREIKELHNKIEFNRYIKSDEAKYTIFSAIGILNKVKQTKFDLHQCDLSELIMTKTKLSGSSIHAVKFIRTNLKESELRNINGERPIFDNSNINSANFDKSRLYRAEFHNVKARSVKFLNCKIIRTNFIDSDLNNADFRNSFIEKTSFEKSILKNADFRNCEFGTEVSFVDADLQSANFSDSKNIPISEIIKAKCLVKARFDNHVIESLKRLKPDLII